MYAVAPQQRLYTGRARASTAGMLLLYLAAVDANQRSSCGALQMPLFTVHELNHVHAGLGELYLAAMDAVHAVAPQTRFYLEGAGQSGLGCNWGDG